MLNRIWVKARHTLVVVDNSIPILLDPLHYLNILGILMHHVDSTFLKTGTGRMDWGLAFVLIGGGS